MKKTFPILGLLLIIVLAGLIETRSNPDNSLTPILYSDSEEVNLEIPEITTPTSLEYFLEGTKEVDGYIVETYREYEIYEDESGNIIKKVPTSNYDYISYKNYND